MQEAEEPSIKIPSDCLPRDYLSYLKIKQIAVGGFLIVKFEQSDGKIYSGVHITRNENDGYSLRALRQEEIIQCTSSLRE